MKMISCLSLLCSVTSGSSCASQVRSGLPQELHGPEGEGEIGARASPRGGRVRQHWPLRAQVTISTFSLAGRLRRCVSARSAPFRGSPLEVRPHSSLCRVWRPCGWRSGRFEDVGRVDGQERLALHEVHPASPTYYSDTIERREKKCSRQLWYRSPCIRCKYCYCHPRTSDCFCGQGTPCGRLAKRMIKSACRYSEHYQNHFSIHFMVPRHGRR